MSINFELIENELILCYTPDYGLENMLDQLAENDSLIIKSTFDVNKENRRLFSNDYDDTLYFSIGEVDGDYIRLFKTVFDTKNNFYFNKAFSFNLKVFVAYQNISILNAIDDVIKQMIKKDYNTIILSSEIAAFSEDIIKKYNTNKNINIIITPRK